MNSLVVKVALGAALLGTPTALFAQRDLARDARVRETTLLTGPYLLSPASPARSPMPNQEWVFIDAQGRPQVLKSRNGNGNTSVAPLREGFRFRPEPTPAQLATAAELERARERLSTATERLQRLQAERAAAVARKRELDEAIRRTLEEHTPPPAPTEPLRFEIQLPPISTELSKKPEPAPLRAEPAASAPKN